VLTFTVEPHVFDGMRQPVINVMQPFLFLSPEILLLYLSC
jgi:hypothetical protein